MAETKMIWASGGRKEAMALLSAMWATGSTAARERIVDVLLAGPPHALLTRVADDERDRSRDRRIFDRLTVVARVGDPPLDPRLRTELNRIEAAYPEWAAPEGERVMFSSWSEFSVGPDTDYGLDDLAKLPQDELVRTLQGTTDLREGLLDAWKQFADTDPESAITTLERLAQGENPGPGDIWEYGLWGLRESVKRPERRSRILAALELVPDALINEPDVARACADFLEAAAGSRPSPTGEDAVWRLLDRTLEAVADNPNNIQGADEHDAVSHAINNALGRLAQAFFALLFGRSLKVSSKIPSDLRLRADALMSMGEPSHRPARVIAAARLSYLFAVDPDWTQSTLIPSFDWTQDEAEATAVWQGYAWQPRIDEKLWPALRPFFLATFEPERLARIGEMAKSLVQLLMLVGIDLDHEQLPTVAVRHAIRSMTDNLRASALSWIETFLAQPDEPEDEASGKPPSRSADTIWTGRVSQWLQQVWPVEVELRSTLTSEQFARIAIATNVSFSDAVDVVTRYMVRTNAFYELHLLAGSAHPDLHPRATVRLIDALADRQSLQMATGDLGPILERARAVDAGIVNLAAFNELWNLVQANPQ
ncbi:hypothetical protein [Sphingomonas sp. Leaf20]|uniref:hypothetical protein n=1 Tax=Sphingomonas sp. Leaf20 TaxID=1735685 RepID=UPI0006FEEC8F|nr:hypothetical protein [Sphingomonas sp. Leaf20]KQM72981.1 hypothetical protein ASE72_19030 [Sphingomonas sp. Leaf20]